MKNIKRILILSLILAAILACFALHTSAVEAATGTCGSGVYWTLDTAGNLTISGSGSMNNYKRVGNSGSDAPWYSRSADIKTVHIGDGVTYIGQWAFTGLQNMTSVTIGSKVTSIGNCAFFWCKGLREVTIPDNVTTLGYSIFNFCSGLSKVTIGSGIRSITFSVFENCTGLTSVTIPDNVTTIEDGTFSGCTKLKTVIIGKNVSQIGYETFAFCDSLRSVYFHGNAPSIAYDSFYRAVNLTLYYIPGTSGWNSLNPDGNWTLATWNGNSPAPDTPKPPEVPARPAPFAHIAYNGKTYDLLTQAVNIQKDSTAAVTVTVNYTEGSGQEKLYLSQDTTHAVELRNNTPKTILPASTFVPGKNIYLLIINEQTGHSVSKPTKLKIVKPETDASLFPGGGNDSLHFTFGSDWGLTLPDCVPGFPGAQLKWSFSPCPIAFEYDAEDPDKVNIVFGLNVISADEKGGKFFKDLDFKAYKNAFKNASKLKRSLPQLRADFNKKNICSMRLFKDNILGGGEGSPSYDFDIQGYAEIKYINNVPTLLEGQICMEAEASYNYQGQLFIWTVPVYFEIGGGIGGGFEGNLINISPETFAPVLEGFVTTTVKGSVGAGFGVAKVATVGGEGEVSLNLKTALTRNYLKCWGEGTVNVNVKVLGKTVAKSDFLKGEHLIYETGNANALIPDTAVQSMSLYGNVDPNAIYENESRAYAAQPTLWHESSISLMAGAYANRDLQLLAENTYTESAPMLCEIDGKQVLVMLWDDQSRTDANRTMVVWSAYDEISGWSAPQPVHNDGTADFYPNFKDGYVVWQNETSALTDDMTLSDIAALGEICLAKWNGNGFDAPVAITDNNTLDTLPAVCAEGDTVTVAWVNNDQNDILGLTGTNTVQSMTLGGEAGALFSGAAPVMALSAGEGHVAFALDGDGDPTTLTDRELYLNGEKLTENDLLDSNPVFAGGRIYYYTGGNMAIYDPAQGTTQLVAEEAVPGLTDAFTLSVNGGQTAIWWANGDDIFCLLNDGSGWTDAVQLTQMDTQCRYPSGLLHADGSMTLGFCSSLWADDTIAQNDLYILQLAPACDLAVENVYADETTHKIHATIRNKGQTNVDGYTIRLEDLSSLTITEPLKAGAATQVALPYTLPENTAKGNFTFEAVTEASDCDSSNNTAEVTLGNCDVEIQDVATYELLPISQTVVTVANSGLSTAENITVSLRETAEDGEVIAEQTIDALSAGESTEVTFAYDVTDTDVRVWFVTVSTETEEISVGNNAQWFTNAAADLPDYEAKLLRCETEETALKIYAGITNNTDAEGEKAAAAAIYTAKGKLKAMSFGSVTLSAYETGSCVLTVEDYTFAEDDYIKLFALDSAESLIPLAAATSDDVYIIQ